MHKTKIFTRISFILVCLLIQCTATADAGEKKRILFYGDSNTFGWITHADGTFDRFPAEQTWPGKAGILLGDNYEIIIEGLGGRTTNLDSTPNAGSGYIPGAGMNGAAYLPACLSSHMPLDLVVIMLGSNDLNVKYNRNAEEIAGGVDELVKIVKEAQWQKHTKFAEPQVLVLAPPMMNIKNEKYKAMFAGAYEKSSQFGQLMQEVADNNNAEFFDTATVVPFGEADDEIHLTLKNHSDLAFAVAKKIKTIFKDTSPLREKYLQHCEDNKMKIEKLPMTASGIVRLSKIEVYPEYLEEYLTYAAEVGTTSLREEPGVLTLYAVAEKENPCIITILETYRSQEAYKAHIASAHFQKYKTGTALMVKNLQLIDQVPLNPRNKLLNFIADK